jgi:hypothetical protein
VETQVDRLSAVPLETFCEASHNAFVL